MNIVNRIKTQEDPRNPCSSPTVQNIKSVACSGTYFNLVCVPFKKSFAVQSARTNRNLGLIHIIARTTRVVFKT